MAQVEPIRGYSTEINVRESRVLQSLYTVAIKHSLSVTELRDATTKMKTLDDHKPVGQPLYQQDMTCPLLTTTAEDTQEQV